MSTAPKATNTTADALAQLQAKQAAREAVLAKHIANGVVIEHLNIDIDDSVVIGKGAVILQGCTLRGRTEIGEGCIIGPHSTITDSVIGKDSTINQSQINQSTIGQANNIGPFTNVRLDTVTDYGVHLGAFVETKNTNFARGNTVSHLTYIGDSDVGKYCNFGCGTVTSNYDGQTKARTTIGDYCFVGCNTNFIPPVCLGDGAYTAAGSTITEDVPAGALAIARERQTNLPQRAKDKLAAYIEKKQKLEKTQA